VTVYDSEQLTDEHVLDRFECGVTALNTWLVGNALRAQHADNARTYVWTRDSPEVMAYFTVAPTQVVKEELSRGVSGGYTVVPGFLLARLALHRSLLGFGYGVELLVDALTRICAAAEISGGRIIVVDAIDGGAGSFYRHHGFHPVKKTPNRLVMKVATASQYLR
jgi:GNAT superfamily N-acetyltransferase